jgi:small neutral amino acid transporter SnatA (MarC family)
MEVAKVGVREWDVIIISPAEREEAQQRPPFLIIIIPLAMGTAMGPSEMVTTIITGTSRISSGGVGPTSH